MFFNEFEKYKNAKLNTNLLWEYNVNDNFDYNKAQRLVVQRVIQLGSLEDFYAIFNMYGGVKGVKKL